MSRIWLTLGVIAAVAVSLVGATVATSAATTSGRQHKGTTIDLVAYSTPQAAYEQLIPAFQETPAGKDVSFSQSYGASGDQSRAVAAGLQADVVDSLARARHRPARQGGHRRRELEHRTRTTGIVTDSVVVFIVRKGNPKHIKGWDDLIKPGVAGAHAEPVHLGRRALERDGRLRRAAQAGQDRQAGDRLPEQALQARRRPGQRARATRCRRSSQGKGDVLIDYENEAIFAEQEGRAARTT